MKLIDVPPSIGVPFATKDGEVVKECTFKHFLTSAMDLYEPMGKGAANVRQAVKIHDAIDSSNGVVRLEDADYAVLKAAVDAAAFVPSYARRVAAFYDAVEKAQDVKA